MSEVHARAVVQTDSAFDVAESAVRLSRSPGVVLAELQRVLDALVALDPAVLADGDAIVALSAEVARLDSVVCRQCGSVRRCGRCRWPIMRSRRAPSVSTM
jgi:hypothetical protein